MSRSPRAGPGSRGSRGFAAPASDSTNWRPTRERAKKEYTAMVTTWRKGSQAKWGREKCRPCPEGQWQI